MTTRGKDFAARNDSDGSRVVFGVGEFAEGSALWSMEFYNDTGVVMTVTVGGQTFDVIGSCDLGDEFGTFAADDAYSVFDVFPADAGGLGAVGNATLVVDGERTAYWSVFQGLEVIGLELTDNSILYEGGMQKNVVGAESEIGTIEIACG